MLYSLSLSLSREMASIAFSILLFIFMIFVELWATNYFSVFSVKFMRDVIMIGMNNRE